MDGYSDPDFVDVAAAFTRQLAGTEGGAALAVYHRGQKVVDLWGGRRTSEGDLWLEDTLAMCFSTTKGVASFALHVQAEKGLIDYDEPVATYWPEFAQNGKEAVTVRHVLTHSAGLHRLRSIIDGAHHMLDWEHMVEALAAEPPAYEPGTKSGYHALTYGWLVGEIVRRVTGKPLAEVVNDDIVVPLGLDGLYLGCPPEERHRVAPLEHMGSLRDRLPAPVRVVEKTIGTTMGKALSLVRSPVNPRRMINALAPRGMEDVITSPEIMDASIPAANGFFTARSLAAMYAVFAGGGALGDVRLLSPARVREIGTVQNNRRDLVLVMPMRWRLGYHHVIGSRGDCPEGFGHFGFGGSGAWSDPSRELAVAMVCNRGSGTPVGDARLMRLSRAAMAAADERPAPTEVRRAG
ncbi:MAG: beta-lactamase family protein [Acidimicrobiia bacterium]|nr:beta-lactamase family protein [Acidimicrobiia bacterium]